MRGKEGKAREDSQGNQPVPWVQRNVVGSIHAPGTDNSAFILTDSVFEEKAKDAVAASRQGKMQQKVREDAGREVKRREQERL